MLHVTHYALRITMSRVFSGIQPTGAIHIGNYLGAIKQWLKLQKKHDCIFCIVDLHALTSPYEPKRLQNSIYEKTAAYLAAGIDPNQSIIFVQSQVKQHPELAWLLSTITPVGELQRMTQYKQKAKKFSTTNAGLLNYPVLMAADILLYQTELVPVGEDQKQHLELTRDIARKFNRKFGKTLVVPKAQLPKTGARIMSLTEPKTKMSKSDPDSSYISLFDKPDLIRKKIMKAQTDSGREIKFAPEPKPGISNLLTIYSLFSSKSIPELEQEFKTKGYQEFKQKLAQLLIKKLKPFRQKKKELDQAQVKKILNRGAKQAQKIAKKTMKEVKKKMGLPSTPRGAG